LKSAATAGDIKALVVGGVEVDDLSDPAAGLDALEAVDFLVSLEVRASAVTERADVILPVAPMAERSGSFVNWEGRLRRFDKVLTSSALNDVRVLAGISEELNRPLGFRTVAEIQAEVRELGPWDGDRAEFVPVSTKATGGQAADGQMTLATWRMMIDDARSINGEPHLLATGRRSVAVLSAADLTRLSVEEGDLVKLFTDAGSVTVPVRVGDIADGVVWLPGNSDGVNLSRDLRAHTGTAVRVEPVPVGQDVEVEEPVSRGSQHEGGAA
jgi:NADH-quinone oxidoreductase subunit G